MKTRLIRGIAALSIVASLGVGLGATTAGAINFGFGNGAPHGHPHCASDAWNIHNCEEI